MPPRKKQAICEIIFGQLRIPVSSKEHGKRVIEGIFMIGEPGKAEAKPRGRKRERRKAKRGKAGVRAKRAGRAKRMKRAARPKGKRMKKAEIAEKPSAAPMTVG